eukprot:CAMPEP_0202694838 /NCGR_PEP_ID=MMETSP1385-20130828/8588_1 /ASSEMBLY_ACC=CAM_ASM_000861 /TAXON_ID=933848 /ORGANISM="Elphidium margaritaceum" /LENGTH=305 /DNA_ID=CAMNT_0049350749 /DNA_START=17 /DNA_END=934 /DNA_ORIENTATION=-
MHMSSFFHKLLFALLLCIYCTFVSAQQDKDYLKMIRKEPYEQMRPWIQCQVCKAAMLHLNKRSRMLKEAYQKSQAMTEEFFYNISKYACQPYHDNGEWILMYDIAREKNKMVLANKNAFGRCGRECETIAFTCQHILDEYEEEIPEYLFRDLKIAKLQKNVCKNLCKPQKHKPPLEDEWGLEEFQKLEADQRQMFKQFVMGELHKREQPKDDQQDYLQRYAEAYVDQEATRKQQKAAKRRYENKMRAKKGLPPLPDDDEEEGGGAAASESESGENVANAAAFTGFDTAPTAEAERTEDVNHKIEL